MPPGFAWRFACGCSARHKLCTTIQCLSTQEQRSEENLLGDVCWCLTHSKSIKTSQNWWILTFGHLEWISATKVFFQVRHSFFKKYFHPNWPINFLFHVSGCVRITVFCWWLKTTNSSENDFGVKTLKFSRSLSQNESSFGDLRGFGKKWRHGHIT